MRRRFGILRTDFKHRVIGLLLLICCALVPQSTIAQSGNPISLLADTINLDQSTGIMTASGNVEVFFGDTVLSASRIEYDSNSGTITAQGPIALTDGRETVLLADYIELSNDLKSALAQGARMMLESQLQLAATEFERTEGRFDTLTNVVASSCQVCGQRPVPIWQIRARQVIRDSKNKQIHFRGATFELFGVPVLYTPYVRIPDPSVRRATGFLTPSILSSEYFGDGLKLPYYIVLNDHADATITATLNVDGAAVLDAQYRQRYAYGGFDAFGAIVVSDKIGDVGRGFLKFDSSFDVMLDATLTLNLIGISDDGFQRQYNYDNRDRLVNEVKLSRYYNRSYFTLAAAVMRSLRDDEDDNTIPKVLPEFSYRGYSNDPYLGGKLGYEFSVIGLMRNIGQDVFRVGAGLDYRIPLQLPLGLQSTGFANLDANIYRVWNSVDFPDAPLFNIHPSIGADIRWPLSKTTATARHIVEPVIQLIYTANPDVNHLVPNEDSQQAEFDETNLFDLNRFPGRDIVETGFRANIGATYTVYNNAGWSLGLAGGLVLRSKPSDLFDKNTLLGGSNSDILGAIRFEAAPNFGIIGRFLFDKDFDFKRSETQFSSSFDKWDINGNFVFLAADTLALASDERGEGTIEAQYRIGDNWSLDVDLTRNLLENQNVSTGLGLKYGNECIEIGLSLSRRFTSSINVTPSTDFNLTFQLAGFGGNSRNDWPAAACAY